MRAKIPNFIHDVRYRKLFPLMAIGLFSITGAAWAFLSHAAIAQSTWISGASGESVASGQFEAWRGEKVEIAGTWTDEGVGTLSTEYANWQQNIDLGFQLLHKTNGETWAKAATGSYDARWSAAFDNINSARAGKSGIVYVRPAYEFNGDWMTDWSVKGSEVNDFKTAWKRLRAIQQQKSSTNTRLSWCPNADTSASLNLNVTDAWPGADQVDVVCIDFYNQYPWVNTTTEFNTVMNNGTATSPIGPEKWRQWAAAQGKPLAFGEWGSNGVCDPANCGGDAPVFFQEMYSWMSVHAGSGAGQFLYEVYFDVESFNPDRRFVLYPGTIQPKAAEAYRALTWGNGGVPITPPPTPTPTRTPAVTVDEKVTTGTNKFAYTGTWVDCGGCNAGAYQNSFKYAYTTGAKVTLSFTGTRATVYGYKEPAGGIASVSIDNGTPFDVDFYSAQQTLAGIYTTPVLSNGAHTLTLTVSGRKASGSSATINIDKAEVFVDIVTPTGPQANISEPAQGATVKGVIPLTTVASDSQGIASVQFKIDGVAFGSAVTASPYTINWDTTAVADGSHSITATATNTSGASVAALPVTVNVKNIVPTPPVVSITAPTSGSTLTGKVTVSAAASDAQGVANVQFRLDGANIGPAITASPYNYSWDTTTSVANGSHTLTAIATNIAGLTTASANVTINVQNTIPTPITGLTGRYYKGKGFTGSLLLTRVDNTVGFNWGTAAPASSVPSDGFSVRWTGQITPPTTGTYTIGFNGDDGYKVYINGALVLNYWKDQGATYKTTSVNMIAGNKYPITIEYYDNKYNAVAQLYWTGPSVSKQIIPSQYLLSQ